MATARSIVVSVALIALVNQVFSTNVNDIELDPKVLSNFSHEDSSLRKGIFSVR